MFLENIHKAGAAPARQKVLQALGLAGRAEALAYLDHCPRHLPTPLFALPNLAKPLGIAALHAKDEGQRLGLKSFKALGGAYAVMRLVVAEAQQRLGRPVAPGEILSQEVRAIAGTMVFACATDGNHGRSVAAGARLIGARSIIFMHERVSAARAEAIAAFGAEVRRVPGTYDESVAEAARQAAAAGWTVVSDTSYEGYEDIPLSVMQGYTVLAGEAFEQLSAPPTHIFVQAGVGGMAAAVGAHAAAFYGQDGPKIIVVEPARAACLFASAKAGRLATAPEGKPTIMGMLECYEPSPLAWEVLASLADGFVRIEDERAIEAMNLLGRPSGNDPRVVAGESGAASFAGLMACLGDAGARQALGLDARSRALVVVSEGATDEALYRQLVGIEP